MQLNFNPFPLRFTKRLKLRKLNLKEDVQGVFELLSNEDNQQYLKRPLTQSLEEAKQHILRMNQGIESNKWIFWGIEKETKLIGTICLWNFGKAQASAEIGYELHPKFQGKGYMTEAMQEVVSYGTKDLGLKQFRALTQAENLPSIHLLEKQDFQLKKVLEDNNHLGQLQRLYL